MMSDWQCTNNLSADISIAKPSEIKNNRLGFLVKLPPKCS